MEKFKIKNLLLLELINKKNAIEDLSRAMSKNIHNVSNVEFKAFYNKGHGWIEERIIMTYRGGAIAVRNVNINSLICDYEEAMKLARGGYYDEVEGYRKMLENENYIDILENLNEFSPEEVY
jgi:hypothetical protein